MRRRTSHFDHALTRASVSRRRPPPRSCSRTEHEEKDAKTGKVEVSKLEHYVGAVALRRALGAYGPVGCLGDAVNLVLAMQNEAQPEDVSERVLVAALKRMKAALDNPAQLDGLWLPTHLQHDCELDDTLSWLLLERVRQLRGGEGPRRCSCSCRRTRGSTWRRHSVQGRSRLPRRRFERTRKPARRMWSPPRTPASELWMMDACGLREGVGLCGGVGWARRTRILHIVVTESARGGHSCVGG